MQDSVPLKRFFDSLQAYCGKTLFTPVTKPAAIILKWLPLFILNSVNTYQIEFQNEFKPGEQKSLNLCPYT